MWCSKCQKELSECICDDLEERLAKLRNSEFLVMKWCARCDKHYAVCKCEDPVWTTNIVMQKIDKMKLEN